MHMPLSILPEEVKTIHDLQSGLEAVIAVHSTALGPAAGGCRFWHYADPMLMRYDAFRLAEGMTYKNALAGLPLGGGKAVIRRPLRDLPRSDLFEAFGRAVASLEGRYITAEDVGTTEADMLSVGRETKHVAGLPTQGAKPGGDPSPWTARGVFLCIEASVALHLRRDLKGCIVAVQGLGNVGTPLARMLHAAGAKLLVADIEKNRADAVMAEFGARAVSVDEILGSEADVFAPCALGAVLHEGSIGSLKAKIVCGGANNQLATFEDGRRLADRGILYAPDYVANAGGIINVAAEYLGWSSERANKLIEETGVRLRAICERAAGAGILPHEAAIEAARAIIAGTGAPVPLGHVA